MLYLMRRERNRLRIIYDDYPRQFWVLVLGTFIDRVGGALLWPICCRIASALKAMAFCASWRTWR